MMKSLVSVWSLMMIFFLSCEKRNERPVDYLTYVNPLIGSSGHGYVTPVSSVPFGMVQVGPDTRTEGSGYQYDDDKILGFSHFHKSGGGCSDYLDILFQPVPGASWKGSGEYPVDGFAFGFSHDNEHATPGNYNVVFDGPGVAVSLTATARCAFHRYLFPEKGSNHVAIDLEHGATGGCTIVPEDNYDTVKVAYIRVIDEHTIEGCRVSEGQAKDAHAYFYAVFSQPMTGYSIFSDRQKIESGPFAEGTDIRSVLDFDMDNNSGLFVKVGISTTGTEGAKKNLEQEIQEWDFDAVKKQAQAAWNSELAKIQVETGDAKQREIFYTSLYYTKMYPMLWMDVDGQYRGADNKIHKADGFNYCGGHLGFWDTYRASYPLLTFTNPDVANGIVKTSLAFYGDFGQLPVLPVFGNESFQMTGLHVMQFIADCYAKGIRNYDAEAVYKAMKHTMMRDTTGFSMRYFTGLKNYKKYGYVPADLEMEATARTLDYAYNDWGIAQMAKMLGKMDDYNYFIERAGSYKNVFDASTGFMRGRLSDGSWRSPFDPFASEHRMDDFCEGNAWHWTFSVAHDIKGLAHLYGGKDKLAEKLDSYFNAPSIVRGDFVSQDITGFIGQYSHGNEPVHHNIFMYSYLGQPWKTQLYTNQVLTTLYDNTPDGICGNEDTGQMSAWYVLSSLGFYPVRPGDGTYVIAAPLFEKATVSLPNGKQLVVKTTGLSAQNIYVQSVRMDGKPYDKVYFLHEDLLKGGEIVFEMGPCPNECWGTEEASWPPSMEDEMDN